MGASSDSTNSNDDSDRPKAWLPGQTNPKESGRPGRRPAPSGGRRSKKQWSRTRLDRSDAPGSICRASSREVHAFGAQGGGAEVDADGIEIADRQVRVGIRRPQHAADPAHDLTACRESTMGRYGRSRGLAARTSGQMHALRSNQALGCTSQRTAGLPRPGATGRPGQPIIATPLDS